MVTIDQQSEIARRWFAVDFFAIGAFIHVLLSRAYMCVSYDFVLL